MPKSTTWLFKSPWLHKNHLQTHPLLLNKITSTQLDVAIRDSNWSKCQEWVMIECSTLEETSISTLLPRFGEKNIRTRGQDGMLQKDILWTCHDHYSHRLTPAVVNYTRHEQDRGEFMRPHSCLRDYCQLMVTKREGISSAVTEQLPLLQETTYPSSC